MEQRKRCAWIQNKWGDSESQKRGRTTSTAYKMTKNWERLQWRWCKYDLFRMWHSQLNGGFHMSQPNLTSASLAIWASSCSWINLLSSSSLALSASSRSCFSLCRRCLSTWTHASRVWMRKRGYGGKYGQWMKETEETIDGIWMNILWTNGSDRRVWFISLHTAPNIGISEVERFGWKPGWQLLTSFLFCQCQYLFSGPLLSGLSLHLLHFKRIYTPPPHEQVMVPYTQLEDLHKRNKTEKHDSSLSLRKISFVCG